MPNLSASDLVNSIENLGTTAIMEYYSGKANLRLCDIIKPEGPITVMRWKNSETSRNAERANVSLQMLSIAATVFSERPNFPVNMDRLFSGGGNTRAVLETLLAHTPNFFICYPQRANPYTGEIDKSLKHIMWCPDKTHPLGEMALNEYAGIITMVELVGNTSAITVTQEMLDEESPTIEAKRTHIEMQAALAKIGAAAEFNIWIARNDRSTLVGDKRLGQMERVIGSLDEVPILYEPEAKKAATNIDCIWFSNDYRKIPGIIEVEHSTGVTSGLTRMQKLRDIIPAISAIYTIVAPNEMRSKVVSEANTDTFRPLNIHYMTYSAVRELDGIIHRYPFPKNLGPEFVNSFMEKVVK